MAAKPPSGRDQENKRSDEKKKRERKGPSDEVIAQRIKEREAEKEAERTAALNQPPPAWEEGLPGYKEALEKPDVDPTVDPRGVESPGSYFETEEALVDLDEFVAVESEEDKSLDELNVQLTQLQEELRQGETKERKTLEPRQESKSDLKSATELISDTKEREEKEKKAKSAFAPIKRLGTPPPVLHQAPQTRGSAPRSQTPGVTSTQPRGPKDDRAPSRPLTPR